jgi:hypothetical protein
MVMKFDLSVFREREPLPLQLFAVPKTVQRFKAALPGVPIVTVRPCPGSNEPWSGVQLIRQPLKSVVGATGFEPVTPAV